MSYEPQINHYVKWTKSVEGWVYFKSKDYITIEVFVKPKNEENVQHCSLHKNERVLVVCYPYQWNQLEYIKSRTSIYEEEENLLAIAS